MRDSLDKSLSRRVICYMVEKIPDNVFFNTTLVFGAMGYCFIYDLKDRVTSNLENKSNIIYAGKKVIDVSLPYLPVLFK